MWRCLRCHILRNQKNFSPLITSPIALIHLAPNSHFLHFRLATSNMARTKQSARCSTGGKATRRSLRQAPRRTPAQTPAAVVNTRIDRRNVSTHYATQHLRDILAVGLLYSIVSTAPCARMEGSCGSAIWKTAIVRCAACASKFRLGSLTGFGTIRSFDASLVIGG
jgi:hypothetical protein